MRTRIADGEEVRVDAPMPWAGVPNTHAEVAAHTADPEAPR